MHRLPCCHPDCPATFKSQHGRTYHIRAVHTNFNSRSINREDDQGLGHHEQDDVHRLTDAGSADGWDTQAGTASVPLDKNTVCGGERIQHPYLTGECNVPLTSISSNIQSFYNHNQHFHVTQMATSCHPVSLHPVEKHNRKGTRTGLPSMTGYNLSLLTFSSVMQHFRHQRSIPSSTYGHGQYLSLMPLVQ
jgi:hypothetical protein